MLPEASHLLETITAFEKALDGPSGDAELDASLAMKTAAISFLRKASERDIQLAELIDVFDRRDDAERPSHTYDAWVEKYKPVKNRLNEHASFEGTMFETFGPEIDLVALSDPKKVWTLIDSDGGSFVEPGFHHVNRLGYFVTELPVQSGDENQTFDIKDGTTEE